MGSTHPPEHRGCNLQLQLYAPSWKCFMLPAHLPAGGCSSTSPAWALSEPCQRMLPARSSDSVHLALSTLPFSALSSCPATSSSCAGGSWGAQRNGVLFISPPLQGPGKPFQEWGMSETPESRMFSASATNHCFFPSAGKKRSCRSSHSCQALDE